LLLGAMTCSVLHAKPGRAAPRGPGQWLPLAEADAFPRARQKLPGRFLDASTIQGALVLAFSSALAVALHFWERQQSPYRAVQLLLACSLLLPVFLTGRARELPLVPGSDLQGLLQRTLRGLRRRGLRAVPLARLPLGSDTADEVRLLVQARGAVSGLVAIEVGVEPAFGVGGVLADPYVLVRVKEDSPCAEILRPSARLERGRKPEERVALLRPKLPTRAETLDLVSRLVELVTRAPDQSSSKRASSTGRGASPRKPTRAPSPSQAIRLA